MERATIILVCMLLTAAAVIPAAGMNEKKLDFLEDQKIFTKTNEADLLSQDDDWWPMVRHDSGNTGSSESLAPDTGRIDWQTNIDEIIYSGAPVIYDNKLYISTNWYFDTMTPPLKSDTKDILNINKPSLNDFIEDFVSNNEKYYGGLYCLDAEDGTPLWYSLGVLTNDAAIYDDKIYFTDFAGYTQGSNLYCLDPVTGSILWQKNIPNGQVFSPTIIYEEKIYLCTSNIWIYPYDSEFVCLDIDGNIEWTYDLGSDELLLGSTPAVYNGNVFFTTSEIIYPYNDGTFYCLDAETGQYKWSETISGGDFWLYGDTLPVCSGEFVYFNNIDYNTYNSDLICFEAETGDIVWTKPVGISFSSPAVFQNNIYFSAIEIDTYDTTVYRINAESGNIIWEKHVPGIAYFGFAGSPVVADSKVYISTVDIAGFSQNIICLNIEDGSIVWANDLGENYSFSGLSIANGRLYTADYEGNVYAFEDLVKVSISGGIGLKLLMENTDDVESADVNWSIRISGGMFGFINKDKTDCCTIDCGCLQTERVIPFGIGDITMIVKVKIPGYEITKWLKGMAIGPIVILN